MNVLPVAPPFSLNVGQLCARDVKPVTQLGDLRDQLELDWV
jgi:hypothetical protein